MNFTKGLMVTCGAVGAVLAVVAVTGLSVDRSIGGSAIAVAPEIVTLAPVVVDLGPRDGQVQVSLRLTVPGFRERDIICALAGKLTTVTAQAVGELVETSAGGARTIPRDMDRVLRPRVDAVIGDRLLEGVEVLVTPAGGTPPEATCRG